jgi:hypothetical protein
MSWTQPVGWKVVCGALLRVLLPCALASAILATGLLAQKPLTGTGSQGITFGAVFPGVSVTVLPNDATRAGTFDVRGQKNLQVQFTFTLPTAMSAGAGKTMPMVFGATSARYARTANLGTSTVFDPRVPLLARLSGTGRLYIWLGGAVSPSPTQAAGAYSATVTLTMAYTGL